MPALQAANSNGWTNRALAAGIFSVLAFGPLAFGAVQPWSIFVLEVSVALLLALWTLAGFWGRFSILPNPLFLPMALFGGVACIQLVFHHTAYWYATWEESLLWSAYGGLFLLVTQVISSRRERVVFFGYFCAIYGFLISLFAIVQQFTGNGKIYWIIPARQGGWIYGPYVNHAYYAGLMEMLVPFSVIFALNRRAKKTSRVFFLFIFVISSSTIFLSQSLGGMIALSVELVILCFFLFQSRFASREIFLLILVCFALAAWLIWLRPPGLVDRMARMLNPIHDAGATGRIAIVKDSLRMVRERPLLGWGLGTFPDVYPSFRSFFTNFWVNEAHNDLIQLLVETGVVGLIFACVFFLLLCRQGLRNLKNWRVDRRTGVKAAAFLGCAGLTVHGLVDFNMHIPANAAFYFALAAIATGNSWSEYEHGETRS